ncbi:MAG: iron-containing alcohol dehydrogenase [Alphaproteobacteria bacterium]|nr:iron-containing alcohol dehydrogenase [Alphaproteobacteria bacterium]
MTLDPYFEPASGGDNAFTVEAPKIKFGAGSLPEVGDDAKALGMTRVALFTDSTVVKLQPLETAKKSLEAAGIDAVVYDETEVEPTDRSFKAATAFAKEGDFDGFVSVGGGSVMDTAKAANLYSTYPDDFLAYVNAPIGGAKPVPGPLKPHIACPTTFGTAAECTGIAIFDLLEMEAKTGIANARLRPNLGILDPTSLVTLPRPIVAANGFDVFSHSIESLTARPFSQREAPENSNARPLNQGANPYSDLACLESIRLVGPNLIAAVNDADNSATLEPLMFASMLAGIGFGNAGCHLPHAMSYAVAGLVRGYNAPGWPSNHPMVPHGISVIVNAPAVFRFTGPACPERHMKAAEAMGADISGVALEEAGAVLADRVIDMMRETDMPNGLSGVGYEESDLEALTDKAFPQKRLLVNSPQEPDRDQLKELFRDSLRYW